MNIHEFLFKNKIKQSDFAARIGVSPKTLWTIIHGANLKMNIAKRIVDASKGQVTYEDIAKEIKEE